VGVGPGGARRLRPPKAKPIFDEVPGNPFHHQLKELTAESLDLAAKAFRVDPKERDKRLGETEKELADPPQSAS